MHPIIREKIPEIARIARRRVKRLGVFGSATGDRFYPAASDVDFVVEFEPMTPVEHAESYVGLAEDLAGLFCRKIDLVELSAIRNPILDPWKRPAGMSMPSREGRKCIRRGCLVCRRRVSTGPLRGGAVSLERA